MALLQQINNLVIRFTEVYQYGVCLEDRMTLQQAEEFCRVTKDYLNRPIKE